MSDNSTTINYKFAIRSIVYFIPYAKKGKLEKLVIKDVMLNKTMNQPIPIYIDTLNAMYNEDELASECDALDMAINYYNDQIIEAQEDLNNTYT